MVEGDSYNSLMPMPRKLTLLSKRLASNARSQGIGLISTDGRTRRPIQNNQK